MPYFITGGFAPEEEGTAQEDRRGNSQFKNLDGDVEQIRLADDSQDEGMRIMHGRFDNGRALLPDHIPTKLTREPWSLDELPLLDVETFAGGNLLVPQVFKDIMDDLEPNVHQFWPMEIYIEGELVVQKYWFVACSRISTLSREHCYPPLDDQGYWDPSPLGQREKDRVVFSSSAIGARHAWVDKFLQDRYFSNTFADRLSRERLTGLRLRSKEEVQT